MSQTSASAMAAAREFWGRALADARPEDIAAAAERVHLHLREGLSRWIGAEGFRALSARAVSLAQGEHPELGTLSFDNDEPALRAAVRLHGVAPVTEALVAQLAAAIDLLGRIVGEEMAMQLVNRAGAMSEPGGSVITIGKESNG